METKHFKEKTIEEAPINLNGDEAQRWCDGYNAALERTAAPELLEACIIALKYFNGLDTPEQNEAAFHALNNAIKKATT